MTKISTKELGVYSMLHHGAVAALVLASMALAEWLTGNPFLGVFCFTALYTIVVALSGGDTGNEGFRAMNSYRMFANMRLLATVAMELSALMLFCHMVLTFAYVPLGWRYAMMTGWMALLYGVGAVYAQMASRRRKGQLLLEFVLGAVIWVTGDVLMLHASGLWGTLGWSMVWALGMVLIYFAITGFSADFEAVGQVVDEECDGDALRSTNRWLGRRATMVSLGVAMLVMLMWSFGGRQLFESPELPRLLQVAMMQLPLIFMLLALIYAIKQPLDARNREKLMHYIDSQTTNEHIRASLHHQLVRGQRVSFGTRLLSWLLMPFMWHRVTGKQHIRKEDYPSVFVCNHGFIYGPMVAALYLPTYFRPWIHDHMLRDDLTEREIESSLPWVKKVFGQRLGSALLGFAAHTTTRILLSFRPIPVVRGASHDTMSTFEQSLAALVEGDNLLIFAEKSVDMGGGEDPDPIRSFYTGFAHLGKLYYNATGCDLLFYPVFANRHRREIKIGVPVAYNHTLPPREAKQAVAAVLHQRMEELSQEQPKGKKRHAEN